MEDKNSTYQSTDKLSSTNLTSNPKYLRMNSTKSELSDKETIDSVRIDSGFMSGSNIDSDFISTCSLLSEDNLNSPTAPEELPHESHHPQHTYHSSHSHFDSGVDIDISEQFSELNLKPNSSSSITSTDDLVKSTSNVELNKEIVHPQESWKMYYCQDEDGDTQLHIAIIEGLVQVIHSLIILAPSSVCLDIRNDISQTALHIAVLTNQPQIVRHLILCNANFHKCDKYARTPLHWAVSRGFVDCVRALIDPITSDEINQIKTLRFDKRTSLKNDTINNTDYEGLTCVHLAAIEGNVDIMRLLIVNGGDVNAKDWKSGMTALHMAVEKHDLPMVMFLLSDEINGINIDIETFAGFTPYQLCYDVKIANLLLNNGAENLPHADDENDMAIDSDEEEDDDDEDEEDVNENEEIMEMASFKETMISATVH